MGKIRQNYHYNVITINIQIVYFNYCIFRSFFLEDYFDLASQITNHSHLQSVDATKAQRRQDNQTGELLNNTGSYTNI